MHANAHTHATPIADGARVIWTADVESRDDEPLWVSVRYVTSEQARASRHSGIMAGDVVIEVTAAPPGQHRHTRVDGSADWAGRQEKGSRAMS